MKTILSWRKHHYVARVTIFFIMVALVAGMVSCGGGARYNLTMAVSPAGAGTTTPTGTTAQAANAAVNIQAVANPGYQFVSWTAPAGTFANPNASTTTFTMPTQAVTVTANFGFGPLDHFMYYIPHPGTAPYIGGEPVYLEDQFGAVTATVRYAKWFANPAEKFYGGNLTPISNPDYHLVVYGITYPEEPRYWQVEVNNQFGTQNLTVWGPSALGVPTWKEYYEPPVGLDHYLLYDVIEGLSVDVTVDLNDQFGGYPEAFVTIPIFFANPVKKTHWNKVTDIVNPETHAVMYSISCGYLWGREIGVVNQFGSQAFELYGPSFLAVPSLKVSYAPYYPD